MLATRILVEHTVIHLLASASLVWQARDVMTITHLSGIQDQARRALPWDMQLQKMGAGGDSGHPKMTLL